MLHGDARVELVGVLAVAHKEHVGCQRHERCAQVLVVLAVAALEGLLYLALGVVFGFQAVAVAPGVLQVFLFHLAGAVVEGALERPVGDEGLGEVVLEVEAVALDLLAGHAQCRRELAQQAAHGIDGNLPYAEEAQHVIDAVGVEVLCHLGEASHPPGAAVLEHLVPVVGGEAPVLAVGGKGVGRGSGLAVEVEVAGLNPSLHAVAAHADGDVALEYDVALAGIVVGLAHLLVEVVLHIVPVGHFLVLAGAAVGHGGAQALVEGAVLGPLAEAGSAVEVAIVAEGCIGHKPLLVGLEVLLEVGRFHGLGALLLVELFHVGQLGLVHALVVDFGQRVELGLQLAVVLATAGVGQLRQLPQVDVLRVQGVDADAVVGVAVGPGVGDGGVVDGQHLQGLLPGRGHIVDHVLEVAEVAHAEAACRLEREHGHHGAGDAPVAYGEAGCGQLIDHAVALLELGQRHGAVAVDFPQDGLVVAVAEGYKLEFYHVALELAGIEHGHPLVARVLGHGYGLEHRPAAQRLPAAHQGKAVACAQLRRAHLEHHCGVVVGGRHGHGVAVCQALGDGRAVVVAVLGNVDPVVEDGDARGLAGCQVEQVALACPLVTLEAAVALHAVEVFYAPCTVSSRCQGGLARPCVAVDGGHCMLRDVAACPHDVQHDFLAEIGVVIQIKFQFHLC